MSPIFIFLKNWIQDTVLPFDYEDSNQTPVMGSWTQSTQGHIPQPHKGTQKKRAITKRSQPLKKYTTPIPIQAVMGMPIP